MIIDNCLFCKIINKDIPADIVLESDEVLVFKDITPQAPVHLLIVPKTHISSPAEFETSNSNIAGKLIATAADISKKMSLDGYRIVLNSGEIAGQSVFHVHAHLLSGRKMNWPPG